MPEPEHERWELDAEWRREIVERLMDGLKAEVARWKELGWKRLN